MPGKRARADAAAPVARAARNEYDANHASTSARDVAGVANDDDDDGANKRRAASLAVKRMMAKDESARACAEGDWTTLRKLHETREMHRLSATQRMRVMLSALYGGQVDVLDWLLSTLKFAFSFSPTSDEDVCLILKSYEWEDFNASHGACLRYLVECGKRVLVLDRLNPMRFAVARGDIDRVRALREFGCPWQSDAIFCASERGHAKMLEVLYDGQCPLNRKRFSRQSPIALALCLGHLECVEFFYARRVTWTDDREILTALEKCCERGDLKSIQWCEERGARLGVTHAKVAATQGHVDVVRHLLDRGCLDEKLGQSIYDVIQKAAVFGQTKMVEYLFTRKLKLKFHEDIPVETLEDYKAMFARFGKKFTPHACFTLNAFANGNLPVLKYLQEEIQVPWDDENIAILIRNESLLWHMSARKDYDDSYKHFPCLRYAMKQGGERSKRAVRALLGLEPGWCGLQYSSITLSRLKFLEEKCGSHSLPWSTTMVMEILDMCEANERERNRLNYGNFGRNHRTIHYGAKEKFLIDHCKLNVDVLRMVVKASNVNMVSALLDRQCPMSADVLVQAIKTFPHARAGEMVRLLLNRGCEVTADAFVQAAKADSLETCHALMDRVDLDVDILDERFLPAAVQAGSLECMNFGFEHAAPHEMRGLLAMATGPCRHALMALLRYQEMYGDNVLGKRLNPKERNLLFQILNIVQEQSEEFTEGDYVEVCGFLQRLYNQK